MNLAQSSFQYKKTPLLLDKILHSYKIVCNNYLQVIGTILARTILAITNSNPNWLTNLNFVHQLFQRASLRTCQSTSCMTKHTYDKLLSKAAKVGENSKVVSVHTELEHTPSNLYQQAISRDSFHSWGDWFGCALRVCCNFLGKMGWLVSPMFCCVSFSFVWLEDL